MNQEIASKLEVIKQNPKPYADWLNDPITREMLSLADERCSLAVTTEVPPVLQGDVDPIQKAAMLYCLHWGRKDVINFFRGILQKQDPVVEPTVTYGAEQQDELLRPKTRKSK